MNQPASSAVRALCLLAFPAVVTALYSLRAIPAPTPSSSRAARAAAPQSGCPRAKPAAKPAAKPVLPRLVAVDRRVARRVNALRPCVKRRLLAAVGRLPQRVTLLVTSAHRTREEQASLRPTFGIKARPGTSTHEDGRAVDLNVLVDGCRVSPRMNAKIIGPVMASVGFRALGPRDPVHYSVPRESVDVTLVSGPELTPPTMAEMVDLRAARARDEAIEVAALTAPAAPAGLSVPKLAAQVFFTAAAVR